MSLRRRRKEDGDIAVPMLAAHDFGAGRLFDAQTLRTDGDAAVLADFQEGAHAPDVRPPRTFGGGAQNKAPFFFGEVPGGLRGHFYFAMDFLGVVMTAEFFKQRVGLVERGDFFDGKKSGEPVLPEVVGAFDFAFGLGRGRVTKGDFIELQGAAQLGESVGCMGEEEAVIIDVKTEGQSDGGKGLGKKIQMGGEIFAFVKFGAGEKATVVVDQLEQRGLIILRGDPAMRGSIVLPELADILHLPAAHRLRFLFVSGIGSEIIF